MIFIEKQELLRRLHTIRQRICCYSGIPCDCKYGICLELPQSEQSGCPELYNVMAILSRMDDETYRDLNNFYVQEIK